ncbi:hypothetical protein BGZ46_007474 [Entomortierella lignicola]|nr:hypothetical protein BGZ46_007474 [Entomortierella lignicola]
MSQSSKPVAASSYLKIAAKVLRLQRALDLSKSSSSKSTKGSARNPLTSSKSTPCTLTTPSFQHSNGRKLHCNQLIHHRSYSSCTTYNQQHFLHRRSERYDDPLCTLQRRCNANGGITNMAQPTSKDIPAFSTNITSTPLSKFYCRSVLPGMYPVINVHPVTHPSSSPVHSSLNRSSSLPAHRQKQFSSQLQEPGISLSQQCDSRTTKSYTVKEPETVSSRSSITILSRTPRAGPKPTLVNTTIVTAVDTRKSEHHLSNESQTIFYSPNALLTFESNRDSSNSKATRQSDTKSVIHYKSAETLVPLAKWRTVATAAPCFTMSMSSRSSIDTSISSDIYDFPADMPSTNSSMSIRSRMSESSILSAAMTASGLPSMEMMMSQVDKSVAEDCQAQLVENAHVGIVTHVSFVDNRLIAEPCSAAIEIWVS